MRVNDSKNPATGEWYDRDGLLAAIENAGLSVQGHYEKYGRLEGVNPNVYFNESAYLSAKLNQLVSLGAKDDSGADYTLGSLKAAISAAGMLPVEHYERYGAFEKDASGNLINPSNAFSANDYVRANTALINPAYPNIPGFMDQVLQSMRQAGLSPVTHYLLYGVAEEHAAGTIFVHPVGEPSRVADAPPFIPTASGMNRISLLEANGDILLAGESTPGSISSFELTGLGSVANMRGMGNSEPAPLFTLGEGKEINAALVGGEGVLVITTSAFEGAHSITGSFAAGNRIRPGAGITAITVGDGDDDIALFAGTLECIDGNGGNDRITLSGKASAGIVSGGAGDDTIALTGGSIDSILYSGNDTITVSGGKVRAIHADAQEIPLLNETIHIEVSGSGSVNSISAGANAAVDVVVSDRGWVNAISAESTGP